MKQTLTNIVDYSTWTFQRSQNSRIASKGTKDSHLPAFGLFLHIMEMTDGIETLLSKSCVNACAPLLRSTFEAVYGIEYIFDSTTVIEYEKRAFSWMVLYYHKQIKKHSKYGTSPINQELRDAISSDLTAQNYILPPEVIAVMDQEKVKLEDLLTKDKYRLIELEYTRLKQISHREPEWYRLFGGPNNLKDLAKYLDDQDIRSGRGSDYGHLMQYMVFQTQWSEIIHAGDISRFLTHDTDGTAAFIALRDYSKLNETAHLTATLALRALKIMLQKFDPDQLDNLKDWYLKEIKHLYLK
jgi:hypothetical protein